MPTFVKPVENGRVLDYDVLLGMDVLANFHITMHGGAFIMSN